MSLQASSGSFESPKYFECGDISGDIKAQVSDGVISGTIGLDKPVEFSSNLNNAGRLYFEVPKGDTFFTTTESVYVEEAGGTGDLRASRVGAQEYHVLEGVLDASGNEGLITYTSAFGMQNEGGCKYSVALKRMAQGV